MHLIGFNFGHFGGGGFVSDEIANSTYKAEQRQLFCEF
jgi:hypothetical protein